MNTKVLSYSIRNCRDSLESENRMDVAFMINLTITSSMRDDTFTSQPSENVKENKTTGIIPIAFVFSKQLQICR